jgi:predicted patatin/cPLA2 family phospholipase
LAVTLAGCIGTGDIRESVPQALLNDANVVGYTGPIRIWGDERGGVTEQEVIALRKQRAAAARTDHSIDPKNVNALTISGGGSSGAFGAGILTGWTAHGDRPKFDIVTGISTGALIAPFAFLGSKYDDQLTEAFTTVEGKDIYERNSLLTALSTGSFTSNAPLRKMIEKYVTDDFIDQVAREHAKGRRLLIGTTNLDAERPVIWNMGAIASSKAPGRTKLFHDVILASAAIPGVFPPVDIPVVADGKTYEEMHVDGGTSNQVFLMPASLSLRKIDRKLGVSGIRRHLYIIRNGRTSPEFSVVKRRLLPIAGKSISSLLKTQGVGDVYRLYTMSKRDGVDFNFIDMPASFTESEKTPFDTKYMNELYRTGYDMALHRVPWEKVPPGYSD